MTTGTNQFTYRGKKSFDDMHLIITHTPALVCASRDIEFISVPGRSGDVLIDNGGYLNVDRTYDVALLAAPAEFYGAAQRIASWLNGAGGYFQLTDTYDPDYYRLARYYGRIEIASILNQIGTATLTFNCKPYRYSFAGQLPRTVRPSDTLVNPEDQPSEPYIMLTGDGDIQIIINKRSYELYDVDGYIEIDSELLSAFRGSAPQNNKIGFSYFPILDPGENTITVIGDVTEISITPRWRAL